MHHSQDNLREWDIFKFQMPLAFSALLMMSTQSIVNAGLARSPQPTLSLASYAVALAVVFVLEGPVIAVRQFSVSMLRNPKNQATVRKTLYIILGLSFLAFATLGLTPLSQLVFGRLMGLEGEVLRNAIWIFRFFIPLPFISGVRGYYQGLAVTAGRSRVILLSMIIRTLFVIAAVTLYSIVPAIPGGMMGAVVMLVGMALEGLIVYLRVRDISDLEAEDSMPAGMSLRLSLRFYLPLALTAIVWGLIGTIINAGLARSDDPQIAVAAFAVASGLCWIMISPTFFMYEAPMVLMKGLASYRVVRRFVFKFVVVLTFLNIAIVYSPLATWILNDLIGVESSLLYPALWATRLLVPMPFLHCYREFFCGIVLCRGNSSIIGLAKGMNVVAVVAVISLSLLLPQGPTGVTVGVLATVAGQGVETLTLWWAASQTMDSLTQEQTASYQAVR